MKAGALQVLIIADDLTGALDSSSPFAQKGWRVRVFTALDAVPSGVVDCDVVAVTTNSRHSPPDEAAALATSAAKLAHMLKPKFVLKKIDSRLKGNVEIECRAVAGELGLRHLWVVPAAPDVGRNVVNGHVVGAGIRDPISVRETFGNLMNVHIPDVATNEEMAQAASQLLLRNDVLAVCSRGLAVELANKLASGCSSPFLPMLPILVGIGTRDPATRAQVQRFQEICQCSVLDAPNGVVVQSAPETDCLLIKITGDGQPSTGIAAFFAKSIRPLVDRLQPRTILLSGGDTATAVLDQFNCGEVEVCGEAAPGLPWGRVALNGHVVQLISKSGSFGSDNSLVDVLGVAVQPSRQEIEHRE